MKIKYNIEIDSDTIKSSLKRIINQIYKLLPYREEGGDWTLPLSTIIEELVGMDSLIESKQDNLFFTLLCKLEGLYSLQKEDDFFTYRRMIFECLSILNKIMKKYSD